MFKDLNGQRLRIEILDTDTHHYRIFDVCNSDEAGNGSSRDRDLNDKNSYDLVEILNCSSFDSEEEHFLHTRACQLSLTPGFTNLISLPMIRDIELYDYQMRTAKTVLQRMRGRALLCDEVGLGKTIEAGLIMMEYIMRGLVKKVLILVPPSLISQWQEEMQRKFNLDFISYDSLKFEKAENGWEEFDKVIASLDSAKREPKRNLIEKVDYDLIIVDEAHRLKNRATVNWKFANNLKKKYILLLTATPVQNKMEELFNLITLLSPGQLSTAVDFRKRFITRGNSLKPKNTEELKTLLKDVMIRNRRSEARVILTKRFAHAILLDLSDEERLFYDQVTEFIRREYSGNKLGPTQLVLKILQREIGSSIEAVLPTLSKIVENPQYPSEMQELVSAAIEVGNNVSTRSKAAALKDLVKGLDNKAVIFTGFQATQAFVAKFLRDSGIQVAEFHGGMYRAEKEASIQAFKGDAQVLVSTESGGEGRNLQFCNVMINYDLPWNPMKIEQRIGRIHRIGQTKDVYIYNLSAKRTIESYILELLDAKINMFELVVGELDMILGNLNDQREFEDIIMEIWSKNQEDNSLIKEISSLGQQLIEAKREYISTKEKDEKFFGELGLYDEERK